MTKLDHEIERYAEYLRSEVGSPDFDLPNEIAELARNTKLGLTNGIPPVHLWHRMPPVLIAAIELRTEFGPTTANSAYRSPAYNLAVGGVGDSQHSQNCALDLRCATGTPREWAAFLRRRRSDGVFTGGIGTYIRQRFVHIDDRGTNADWSK